MDILLIESRAHIQRARFMLKVKSCYACLLNVTLYTISHEYHIQWIHTGYCLYYRQYLIQTMTGMNLLYVFFFVFFLVFFHSLFLFCSKLLLYCQAHHPLHDHISTPPRRRHGTDWIQEMHQCYADLMEKDLNVDPRRTTTLSPWEDLPYTCIAV